MTQTQPMNPVVAGLDGDFEARINALIAASGGRIRIQSGYRSSQQQAALYAEAVKRYGAAGASKWVAAPGHSNHERGLAVDLAGDLALAHKLAPQFGLVAPMSWEDWHFEPAGLRSNPQAYTTPPPGHPDPTDPNMAVPLQQHLASIAHAMRFGVEDQPAIAAHDKAAATAAQPAPVQQQSAVPAPIAPITAPAPMEPQSQSTGDVIASPTAAGDTQKILAGTPVTDAPAAVNAAAGQTGVMGNTSGVGHIQSTPQREAFASAVLTKMGLPVTPENMRVMVAWQQGEGTSAAWNPLATTDSAAGSSQFNSVGVQNFTSFEQGVDTTIRTLSNGRYGNIISALQAGNSAMAVAQAIANSPWGTGALVLRILGGG